MNEERKWREDLVHLYRAPAGVVIEHVEALESQLAAAHVEIATLREQKDILADAVNLGAQLLVDARRQRDAAAGALERSYACWN